MSIFDPYIATNEDETITSCLPGLGGQALWLAAPWGAACVGERLRREWEDAAIRESVDVAEMRSWCWHRGAGEIHGALFELQSLDMLLEWFAADALEMRFVAFEGGGLFFSDGERVAQIPASAWTVPETLPCRACGAIPKNHTKKTPSGGETETSLRFACTCGMRSPWRAGLPHALEVWNEFCGEPLAHPPIWKWSARKSLAEHRPTFGPPVPLPWFDDKGLGPSTVPLLLEGMKLLGSVRLRLPGTLLDGFGCMDIQTLRALHAMVSGALEWAEGKERDR